MTEEDKQEQEETQEPAADEAGASDDVGEEAAEPAAPSAAAPDDTGAEGEDVGGDVPADAPAAAKPDAEAEEVPGPKQLRKAARAQASGPPKPPRSPEERAVERADRRRRAAASRRRWRASRRAKRGEPGQGTAPADRRPGSQKVRQGTVVSNKADKTITVRIEVARRHPTYEKVVRRSTTLHAHDEANEANEGDVVRVIESRPLSRSKRWRLVEVLERAR
jgi:small subunit ribosomal protein S17